MKEYFVWLAKLLTIVFIFLIIIPAIIGALAAVSKTDLAATNGNGIKKKIAVVELSGMIEDSKEIVRQLHVQVENKDIHGIVLRINSPGGMVAPSQDIYEAVKVLKATKPIVASMGSVAASGGFYSAIGATKVFCQPGTLTGSIGVIMQLPNFTKITETVGVDFVTIKSGKFKDVGNSFRVMSEDEKVFLQTTVDEIHNVFVKAVSESRNIPEDKVREFADGRVILGSQAVQLGLADSFGGLNDAAKEIFKIKGIELAPGEEPELVYTEDKLEKFRKLLEAAIDLPLRMMQGVNPQGFEAKYIMY